MAVNVKFLTNNYFCFDYNVPYKINEEYILNISPIKIPFSNMFLDNVDILQIDKNASDSVEIIQMSYLKFLLYIFLNPEMEKIYKLKLSVILSACLSLDDWEIVLDEKSRAFLLDNKTNQKISAKQFDEIKKIILYQNLPHYDDEYINPDLKKSMEEKDRLTQKDIDPPDLERRMAIITAHTGLSKQFQMEMTMRSHQILFEEVYSEVEYTTIRPIALYAGKADDIHWIFKKKKDKFEGYITSVEQVNKSMGGSGKVKSTTIDNPSLNININKFLGGK